MPALEDGSSRQRGCVHATCGRDSMARKAGKVTGKARTSGQKGPTDAAAPPQETGKSRELKTFTVDPGPTLTTNQGVVVSDDQNSLTLNVRGPTLLEDIL